MRDPEGQGVVEAESERVQPLVHRVIGGEMDDAQGRPPAPLEGDAFDEVRRGRRLGDDRDPRPRLFQQGKEAGASAAVVRASPHPATGSAAASAIHTRRWSDGPAGWCAMPATVARPG